MSDLSVSVVTPSLNQGEFIEETIRSVLNQEYPRLEYMVVDGGSTDQTLDILHHYENRLTWISEPDDGPPDAINKGLARTRGDIFAYMNSDDTYCPGAIEQAVRYFADHPDVDMVFGDANVIDRDGKVYHQWRAPGWDLPGFLCWRFPILQPSVFLRRKLMDRVGPFRLVPGWGWDYDYWLMVGGSGAEVGHIPGALSNARYHAGAGGVAQSVKLADHLIFIWERFFNQECPPALAHLRGPAIGGAYVYRGFCHYEKGEMAQARRDCLHALHLTTTSHISKRAVILMAKTVLGAKLSQTLREVKRSRARVRFAQASLTR